MIGHTPQIDVRALQFDDALAIHQLDYSFETDRILTLSVHGRLMPARSGPLLADEPALAFELIETPVDPPLYKDYREFENTLEDVQAKLRLADGGYIASADGQTAGAIILSVEEWRSVARIQDMIVSRYFRRYGIGSLLLNCATDWARKQGCWAIVLETQNVNYPAIQFYLRNGLQIWSIQRHFYPPGPVEHEIAVIMGKKLVPGT